MKKRFIFKDEVLFHDFNVSKDILSYLKSQDSEILVYSDNSYEQMQVFNLYANVDTLIPNTTDNNIIQSFSKNHFLYLFTFKRDSLREKRRCHILTDWEKYYAGIYSWKDSAQKERFLKDFIFVSDSIEVCEAARMQGFQSIYYEKDKRVITGRKIKSLDTLKSIYS